MKSNTSYIWAIVTLSIVSLALAASLWLCNKCGFSKSAPELAKKALTLSLDRPESLEIISVSDPDSVFGRRYASDSEKLDIMDRLMTMADSCVPTAETDFSDPQTMFDLERQMNASTTLAPMLRFDTDPEARSSEKFSGYRVKIEYRAVSAQGIPFHAENWFIIDPDCQSVINSFEIPMI